jgi:hypothetical protein
VVAIPIPLAHPIHQGHQGYQVHGGSGSDGDESIYASDHEKTAGDFSVLIERLLQPFGSFAPVLAIRVVLDEMSEHVVASLESTGSCGVTAVEQMSLLRSIAVLRNKSEIWNEQVEDEASSLVSSLGLPSSLDAAMEKLAAEEEATMRRRSGGGGTGAGGSSVSSSSGNRAGARRRKSIRTATTNSALRRQSSFEHNK